MSDSPPTIKHQVVIDPSGDVIPDLPVKSLWIEEPRNSWWPFGRHKLRLKYENGTGWTWYFNTRNEAESYREKLKRAFRIRTP